MDDKTEEPFLKNIPSINLSTIQKKVYKRNSPGTSPEPSPSSVVKRRMSQNFEDSQKISNKDGQ